MMTKYQNIYKDGNLHAAFKEGLDKNYHKATSSDFLELLSKMNNKEISQWSNQHD